MQHTKKQRITEKTTVETVSWYSSSQRRAPGVVSISSAEATARRRQQQLFLKRMLKN